MISRTALYTIRALILLAPLPDGEYVGAGALAREIDAPPNYLSKLLQSMARGGFVESRKGSGGGFRLARAPGEISLYDVVDSIDQVGRWNGCFLGRSECSDENACVVHDRWSVLRDDYMSLLSQTSLANLMDSEDEGTDALDPARALKAPPATARRKPPARPKRKDDEK